MTHEHTETCAHHDCGAIATDRRHGMPLCRAHLFLALQWELQPA